MESQELLTKGEVIKHEILVGPEGAEHIRIYPASLIKIESWVSGNRSIALLESAGYACTRAAASLGIFDIIGISATDVVLVQTKSNDWPGSVEMAAIHNFQCPPLCKKLVHRWRDRARLPDVRTV